MIMIILYYLVAFAFLITAHTMKSAELTVYKSIEKHAFILIGVIFAVGATILQAIEKL